MPAIRFDSIKLDKLLKEEYSRYIGQALEDCAGLNDLNRYAGEFETEFSRYLRAKFCVVLDSGTSSLQLALLASGIGKNDAVIIPAISHPATAWAVESLGAKVIFADISQSDLTIDPDKIEAAMRKDVKAIIAVHLYGMVCDMASINRIAKRHRLKVIEDACHSLGSTLNGRKTGTLGDCGIFSFAYFKTLSSIKGSGGCLVSQNTAYKSNTGKILASKYRNNVEFKDPSFLDIMILLKKIKFMAKIEESKINIQNNYFGLLRKAAGLTLLKPLTGSRPMLMLYPLLAKNRDLLNKRLATSGVLCAPAYKPLYYMFGESKPDKRSFPVAERYFREALFLPAFPFMKSDEVSYIAGVIGKALRP
ncbi:MAG: aminotransferase class I/II-fold pyridoxal phosphate-dependent enzyme [Candidatus Omnitrophica bacterium]|nr:aminotransferase class I/II-fold pyridoxal phosphate-dependent enzyme [Candidatus Omnitrophota bacterium]